MVGSVGIVVNPVSGTDIRRLSSYANFVDNNQKAYILLKAIKVLEGLGVSKVILAPDFYGIINKTLDALGKISVDIDIIDMKPVGGPEDTLVSVDYMVRHNAACIIILGGDGTVRIASKVSNQTPLIPISTGTNNVIPYFIDGSVAGFAAGVIALNKKSSIYYTVKIKKLDVFINGEFRDHALVDVALTEYIFRGSKAVIDVEKVGEAIVSIAKPTSIGLSSIGAMIEPIRMGSDKAIYFSLNRDSFGLKLRALIGPGILKSVIVNRVKIYKAGDIVVFNRTKKTYTIALDGEREIEVDPSDEIKAYINPDGPIIVDIENLVKAIAEGFIKI
ncbi:MAG: NAD(+)/NADH kinase [Candidatus Bathyarchaeia archaeon]